MINNQIITPEVIQQRKAKLRREIRKSKTAIGDKMHNMMRPVPVRNKFEMGYQWVSNGLAIYDGIKIGLQVVRYIKRFI